MQEHAQLTVNFGNEKNTTVSNNQDFSVFDNGDNSTQITAILVDIQILTAVLCDKHGISFPVFTYGSVKTKEKSGS